MTSITEQATGIPSGTWSFDAVHSSIGFTVVYMGVAPFQGSFRDVSATLDATGLRGTAKASSIDVDNDALTQHLASPEFFDVENHPELSFETEAIERHGSSVKVDGELVIKGNAAPVTLTGTITDPVADPWGNQKLGLKLSGTVDRHDVGLTWNAPLPDGGSMLADDVELSASLVFVQSPEA